MEGLPAPATKKMSYYERWAASVAAISMERGTIQQRDIDRHLGVSTDEPDVKCAPVVCTVSVMRSCCNKLQIALSYAGFVRVIMYKYSLKMLQSGRANLTSAPLGTFLALLVLWKENVWEWRTTRRALPFDRRATPACCSMQM